MAQNTPTKSETLFTPLHHPSTLDERERRTTGQRTGGDDLEVTQLGVPMPAPKPSDLYPGRTDTNINETLSETNHASPSGLTNGDDTHTDETTRYNITTGYSKSRHLEILHELQTNAYIERDTMRYSALLSEMLSLTQSESQDEERLFYFPVIDANSGHSLSLTHKHRNNLLSVCYLTR